MAKGIACWKAFAQRSSRSFGEKSPSWRLHLLETPVEVFLASNTKWGPWHRGEPLRVDVLVTLLARPEAAFLNSTEGRNGVSKLAKFTVEIMSSSILRFVVSFKGPRLVTRRR
jgi:hypothetical protein